VTGERHTARLVFYGVSEPNDAEYLPAKVA